MSNTLRQNFPQSGHRHRLREKFLQGGLAGFLDHEIVEILLTLGTPRRDCRQEARELLKHFKSLRAVLEADRHELLQFRGLGPHNIFGLLLIREVSRRFLRDRMMEKPICNSSREVFDFLYHALRDARKEKFKVLFLNTKNQILEEKTFFEGTVDTSAVYPREIFKQALLLHASSLIFIHNHPSGDPTPSDNDKAITRELVQAGITMQIKILDHIIIGNNRYFSFADAGLLHSYEVGLNR
ncbi:MAG: DNA repair protein RadC [Acidobacteria bacterium]|nr:DNA repair protein RadC [Acidobacteriota bacterium]MBU1475456.1 DNA repair protein RadC [Acidobacteriota bacterium]MBU4330159.1 DNA repair protein RadC [Acidobacteriota bacterium]MBU4495243.1 DNA repair protein RadC [Acidobacteriota bacterium]